MEIEGLTLDGNYSFDGCKNVTIRNSHLLSKDAFWNCENITVYDSFVSGEYFGWNAKNVTLINCTIESEQGLLLQRRPARGLLAGLWQPAAWEKVLTRDELTAALAGIGVQAALDAPLPPAKHVFTHKIWELGGWRGTAPACTLPDGYVWAAPEDCAEVYPVPNAFGAYVKAK